MTIVRNHELFPQEGDGPENITEVEFIQVFRRDGMSREVLSGQIPAMDLQKEEQILQKYGPGHYEIVARAKNRITRRRDVRFPMPYPMGATSGGAAGAPAHAPPASSGIDMTALLQIIMQQAQQSNAQLLALMTTFMTQSESKSAQMMQVIQASNQAQMTSMSEFFKALSGNQAAPTKDVFSAFEKGMDLAKRIPAGDAAKGATGIPNALDATSNFIGAMVAAKQSGLLADFLKPAEAAPAAKPAAATPPAAQEPRRLRAVPQQPSAATPPASAQHPRAEPAPARAPAPPAPPRAPGPTPPASPATPPPPPAAAERLPSEAPTGQNAIIRAPQVAVPPLPGSPTPARGVA